ncbi:hypothetical protein FOA52_013333 [Chlamydomonas sp. UWO 241]|nr:hypothetical protein FOA52_013333 [Chlamydomonas sp. UWO 241]
MLLIVLLLMLLIMYRRRKQQFSVVYNDPVALAKAADGVAARMQQHYGGGYYGSPSHRDPAGHDVGYARSDQGSPYAPEGPHPALVHQQLQWEFAMQQHSIKDSKGARSVQELALSGAGPSVDASSLAQRLVQSGQTDAAMAVATAAGIKHLMPGVMPVPAGYAHQGQGSNVGYYAGSGGSASRPAQLAPLPGGYQSASPGPAGRLPSMQGYGSYQGTPGSYQGTPGSYQGTPSSVAASQALATYPVQWSPSGPPPAGMPLPRSGAQPMPSSPYAGGGVYH